MPQSISVFTSLQPTETVALGRLVVDIHRPWQDFCPSSNVPVMSQDIALKKIFNVREILDLSKGTKFSLQLTKFLTSFFKTDEGNLSDLAAKEASSYLLLNSGVHFQRLCGDDETRRWLENVIKIGYSSYMIVGIHTVNTATVVRKAAQSSKSKASFQIPLQEVMGVPSGVSSLDDSLLNVSAEAEWSHNDSEMSSFMTADEQVLAVEYRKVQFKWYSSHKLDSSFLKKENVWSIFTASRTGDEKEEDDVVEADFEDEVDEKDPDIDCESFKWGKDNDEFLFVVE